MCDSYLVKVSGKETLKEYARLALESKMYVDDGQHVLQHDYRYILEEARYRLFKWIHLGKMRVRPYWIIGLCYVDSDLVGVGVVGRFQLQVYTRPDYRGRGVASTIVHAMSSTYGLDHKVGMHTTDEASIAFVRRFKLIDLNTTSILKDQGNLLPPKV